MKNFKNILTLCFFFVVLSGIAQKTKKGHTNNNKFKQLKDEFATPNAQHTASGAPGYDYTQQQVDYKMDIVLDDKTQKITGSESIVYHNNSKDVLEYLWIQLDQNVRSKDSKSDDIEVSNNTMYASDKSFAKMITTRKGGFNITAVKDKNGADLDYTINRTMMRLDLPTPLKPGEKFEFSIGWWYHINEYLKEGGRSGFEHFKKDGNNVYVIAQFFPRLCVYDNVEGWQNMQFWGRSEFALEFGNYTVNITTPKDHILNATGVLMNPEQVLTKKQFKRFQNAKTSFKKPVFIVTQKEAEKAEKKKSKQTKTWSFYAENVRDFGFASSRKFIWDAMAVDINGKTVMAYSLYPKEGNPLWEEYSTKVVAHSLKTYSKYTFDYPYHKAISVHARSQGMEYPQICWNYGRPREDGTYSERTKHGMIGVITHEVGHNFFPMIVNSDERQWTWMDEGLNSFMDALTQLEFNEKFDEKIDPRSAPKDIVPYMSGDQSQLAPIMTQGDNVYRFGPNAYTKPAAGLFILRNTILGPKLFDKAFSIYSKRWMFKHPTPEDFFRTMEDASGTDLDWFWRGWFYTTDVTDIGIKAVNKLYATEEPSEEFVQMLRDRGLEQERIDEILKDKKMYFTKKERSEKQAKAYKKSKMLKKYATVGTMKTPAYFYEITFEKPGGLVMPIIVEFTYVDGTKSRKTYPAQIWRKNDDQVTKLFPSEKEIKSIVVDPDLETADVDTSNNTWPPTKADLFDLKKRTLN